MAKNRTVIIPEILSQQYINLVIIQTDPDDRLSIRQSLMEGKK